MLLVLNVNNTNTVMPPSAADGVTGGLRATWRISTRQGQTADEYGILVRSLLQSESVESLRCAGS